MIAFFVPTLGGGGAERNMINLAKGFSERNHQVVLVLTRAEGPFLQETGAEVEVVDLRATRVATSLVPLVRFLNKRRPRALLSTLSHANVLAVWARDLADPPVRLVLREANTFSQIAKNPQNLTDRLLPMLVRSFYPRAERVVAVSEGAAKDLRATANLSNVCSIPNPAVTPDIRQRANEPINHPWFATDEPPIVLAVGSLTKQKDYPTLISAFQKLRTDRPCRLLILGEGPERSRLEQFRKQLGLGHDDVAFPGFVSNPFPYMAQADVLALSSRWEGWPNVCAQALAVGTPVVATNCPNGPEEILDGGRFGRLVPVGDAEHLAKALAATLDAPPQPNILQERAQKFTLARAVDAYLEVLGVTEP